MQFSEQWLRQWVNPNISTQQLCGQLTSLGLEVDSFINIEPQIERVVVGEVIDCQRHPNADRLSCCKVKVNQQEIVEIVCGAANVRQGLKVAVVLVGGVLPGDFKIKATQLRGMPSHGMICSATELGLAAISEGILELPDDAPIGKNIVDYLQLKDHVIDVELTPNRGDCLSILGVAREIAAHNKLKINLPSIKKSTSKCQTKITIELKDKTACPRYCGRVIENIHADAKTPLWLQECLRRSGMRAIHPVVDVMNYVMLELGQPMHAFDLAKMDKKIVVRQATAGEKLILLDDQVIELTKQDLVIADHANVLALAGVMGGSESAVSDNTQSIFLESAFFMPLGIAHSARAHGLVSDSSQRFERGVDFNLPRQALVRASELLHDIVGGDAGPIVEVMDKTSLPQRKAIPFAVSEIERLLGVRIPLKDAKRMLESLGMKVKTATKTWQVTAPSYRFDIAKSADCVEEIARMFGYDNIPLQPLQGNLLIQPIVETHLFAPQITQKLINRDYNEVITYSFVDEALQQQLFPEAELIRLRNPLNQDLAVMRTSIWPGLLRALQFNVNHQAKRVRLFEIGHCFTKIANKIHESQKLAGLIYGLAQPVGWAHPERQADFFDIKSDVEFLLANAKGQLEWRTESCTTLHPGQSAALYLDGKRIGWVGALHPTLVQQLGLNAVPYLFELELAAVDQVRLPRYCPISKFPAISRDLAIVVDEAVQVAEITSKISHYAGNLLNKVEIFDIYRGNGIAEGSKSVALGLSFMETGRTLQDAEINAIMERVIKGLTDTLGAQMRT